MTLSIRHYVIIFTSIITLLTAAFIYTVNSNINNSHEKIIRSQSAAATRELNKAIELMTENIKKSAQQLASWEEVKQQINNPGIFAYWYSVRFKKYAFDLQKHTLDFMIYDASGNALSLLDDINLPTKTETEDITGFQFRITSHYQLIYIIPVYSEKNAQTIIGFISSRINFVPLLRSIVHYQFIDPESLQVKVSREKQYRTALSSEDFKYNLHQSTHLSILENQFTSSLLGMVFFLVVPVIILFVAIIFLIGRPVKDVATYINTPTCQHRTAALLVSGSLNCWQFMTKSRNTATN